MDSTITGLGPTVRTSLLTERRLDTEKLARSTPAEAAREMEALFATILVKEMRKSLPEGMFGSGPGADAYEGWFDEHIGRQLADSGALELAGMIKTALDRGVTAESSEEEGQ